VKFVPGCSCCCAVASITVDAKCGGSGAALTSVTFDLRDAADTTTLATASGSSATFTGLDGSLSYKVRVSKTGYHTKTSTTITPGCGGSSSVTVSTWPTTYSLQFHVQLTDAVGDCPLAGADVTVTGDGSGSGTTDAAGDVTLSLSSSSSSVTQSLSYTVTPPSGHGAAVKTGSISVNACSPTLQTITLIPSSGHVGAICNTRYMPDTLSWTDDYGTGSATWGGGRTWGGSYTYSSDHAFEDELCSGFVLPFAENTADVTVDFVIDADIVGSSCSSTHFTFTRSLWLGEGPKCGSGTVYCEPIADSITSVSTPSYGAYTDSVPVSVSSSCGTSISLAFTIAPVAASGCATYLESGVNVNVGGTI